MSAPKVSLEDELFRRYIQDKLNQIKDNQDMKKAAELLADSLIQARAALKWALLQARKK